ncbi:MAG: hypothetical protein KAS23_05650 [Anaerohalosphaera sp.]|nr:hypothetical protein [Anaerohalosphaera sp.]
MAQDYKNILIIKPSALGDVITALPAVNALKQRYPHAKITWLIRPEFAPILDCAPGVDKNSFLTEKSLANGGVVPNPSNCC